MRTRPRPCNREAATATLRARYIPLRNQSRLVSGGLIWGRLVPALLPSAWLQLLGERLVAADCCPYAAHVLSQFFDALAEFLAALFPWGRGD